MRRVVVKYLHLACCVVDGVLPMDMEAIVERVRVSYSTLFVFAGGDQGNPPRPA